MRKKINQIRAVFWMATLCVAQGALCRSYLDTMESVFKKKQEEKEAILEEMKKKLEENRQAASQVQ
jgi:hypothetical protein